MTEARHFMAGQSLHEGPERPLCEAVKVKPGLCWKLQDVRGDGDMEYLPRRDANREWNHPKRKKYVAGSKDGRTEPFQPSTPETKPQVWSLLLWVSVLLWYSIPLLCHNASLTEWQFIYCATVCWKYVTCF